MKGENLILEQGSKSRATRAVKILDLRDVANGSDVELCDKRLQSCKNEVSLWKKIMYYPNMVRLHEVFSDKYLCYFVMERCKSSLFKYMEDLPVINERSTGKLLVQMILAINHMHSHRVVHRDVKPDNFLMGGPEGSTLKLCDYGLSAMLPEEGQLVGVHGTAPYMCPEMLRLRLSDEKADVWSVGVVAYLLLCGKFPYQPSAREWNGKKMQELIRDGARPTCERSWLSDSASFMLKKMLTRKSVPRPSAQEALHLPFIVDNTLDSKESEENLPCLRSVLEAAVSLGSCHRNLDEESSLDVYLNFKQDFVGGVKKEHVDTAAPNDEGDGLGPELDDAAVFEKGDHINVSKQTFTWKASRDDVDGRGRDQITES
jgi:serine/threonine protein kinase